MSCATKEMTRRQIRHDRIVSSVVPWPRRAHLEMQPNWPWAFSMLRLIFFACMAFDAVPR